MWTPPGLSDSSKRLASPSIFSLKVYGDGLTNETHTERKQQGEEEYRDLAIGAAIETRSEKQLFE